MEIGMEVGQFAINEFGTNIEISALFMLTAEVEMNQCSQLQNVGPIEQNYSVHEQKPYF
jgi:hypothetical protein